MGVKVRENKKNSGIWYVFVTLNKKRDVYQVGEKSTAEDVAKTFKAEIALGKYIPKKEREAKKEQDRKETMTFKEVTEKYVKTKMREDWRKGTKDDHMVSYKNHAYPVIGAMAIKDIKKIHLIGFFDGLAEKGLSKNTINKIKIHLNGPIEYALERELIKENPLSKIKIKKKKNTNSDIHPLKEAGVKKLLSVSKTFLNGHYYAPIMFSIFTGIRIGELSALEWDDIDLVEQTATINKSYRDGLISPPKNGEARTIDLTPKLIAALKEYRKNNLRNALKKGRPVSSAVFINTIGSRLKRGSFREALNKCLDLGKISRIRVHDLRHTCVTLRLVRGDNLVDVSKQIGHSSPEITMKVYCHWIPSNFKHEVVRFDALLENDTQTTLEISHCPN